MPATIRARAPERDPKSVEELDDASRSIVQTALNNARVGPSVFRRRGSPKAKPWRQPQHIEFSDGKDAIQVHVSTGAVYKRDLPEQKKAEIRESVAKEPEPESSDVRAEVRRDEKLDG